MSRIVAARGVAVLAIRSFAPQNDAELETMVKNLVDQGLDGIEVIHSDHDDATIEKLSRLADRFQLIKTGGSDFHGMNKKDIRLGDANERSRRDFDRLRECVRSRNRRVRCERWRAPLHTSDDVGGRACEAS